VKTFGKMLSDQTDEMQRNDWWTPCMFDCSSLHKTIFGISRPYGSYFSNGGHQFWKPALPMTAATDGGDMNDPHSTLQNRGNLYVV
jgi:hypothetical protein